MVSQDNERSTHTYYFAHGQLSCHSGKHGAEDLIVTGRHIGPLEELGNLEGNTMCGVLHCLTEDLGDIGVLNCWPPAKGFGEFFSLIVLAVDPRVDDEGANIHPQAYQSYRDLRKQFDRIATKNDSGVWKFQTQLRVLFLTAIRSEERRVGK